MEFFSKDVLESAKSWPFIEAKKLIEKAPVEIFCGKAVEVKTIKEKLEAANIEIRIEPEFPY